MQKKQPSNIILILRRPIFPSVCLLVFMRMRQSEWFNQMNIMKMPDMKLTVMFNTQLLSY